MPSGRSPPSAFGIITRRTGSGRYVFATKSSRRPASHASRPCSSICAKSHPVHTRSAGIGAGKPIGVTQDVLTANLVVEHVEAEGRLRLRLAIELSLKGPDLVRCCQAHRQSPSPHHLRKRTRSQGPLLRRRYPASSLIRPCPTPAMAVALRDVEAATLANDGSPPITRTTFPTCRAHYPGGSSGCACRLLPRSCSLPQMAGGSASALSLSRPAQASHTLRPAGSLSRPRRPLSRGSDPAGCPTRAARQLPDLSTIIRVRSSLTDGSRLRGALPIADHTVTRPSQIGQSGQYPLTALARAEYPIPPGKGRRSARTASISACRSLRDMAAITFVVGAYRGVCESQKSSKSRNDTATSMEVVVIALSLPFSKRSASTASPDASVPGTGGASMPIRRIARRRGPLGESSAAKSHTHAAIRPPGRVTRRISDIARALLGTKFMTSADATTSKDASANGNSCASASRNSAFLCASLASVGDLRLRPVYGDH